MLALTASYLDGATLCPHTDQRLTVDKIASVTEQVDRSIRDLFYSSP